MVLYGMVLYCMVWYGMVWYGMVWYGMVWYGMVWYGMVWCGRGLWRCSIMLTYLKHDRICNARERGVVAACTYNASTNYNQFSCHVQ